MGSDGIPPQLEAAQIAFLVAADLLGERTPDDGDLSALTSDERAAVKELVMPVIKLIGDTKRSWAWDMFWRGGIAFVSGDFAGGVRQMGDGVASLSDVKPKAVEVREVMLGFFCKQTPTLNGRPLF